MGFLIHVSFMDSRNCRIYHQQDIGCIKSVSAKSITLQTFIEASADRLPSLVCYCNREKKNQDVPHDQNQLISILTNYQTYRTICLTEQNGIEFYMSKKKKKNPYKLNCVKSFFSYFQVTNVHLMTANHNNHDWYM